jgi:hypothetical protein
MAMGCELDGWGLIPGRGKRLLFISQLPDRLWDTLSLFFNGYWG